MWNGQATESAHSKLKHATVQVSLSIRNKRITIRRKLASPKQLQRDHVTTQSKQHLGKKKKERVMLK